MALQQNELETDQTFFEKSNQEKKMFLKSNHHPFYNLHGE